MYRNVIWATDGSPEANGALREALRLVAPDGRIVAVHCDQRLAGRAGPWPALADEDERRTAIREHVASLRRDGVAIDLVVERTSREPAAVVARVAEDCEADVIVCGTHGRGPLTAAVLGSVAHDLIHEATCPVVVVPALAATPERTEVVSAV